MSEGNQFRPRRSCLYIPGANARALEKAASLPADMLILDLEDAVAPEAKTGARSAVASAVKGKGFGDREVVVRINSLDTEWGAEDLSAAVSAEPDGILVPKLTSGDELRKVDEALSLAGATSQLALWVMIEMPLAIINIGEIARASRDSRLAGFVLGTNDLAKAMDVLPTPDRSGFLVSLSLSVAAAKAYDLTVIDGVFNDIKDQAGFEAECLQGRVLGFNGKSLVHPCQIDTANRQFAPDPQAVARAEAIVAAFMLPENRGKGVIKLNGEMVELLHFAQAKRLLEIDNTIRKAG